MTNVDADNIAPELLERMGLSEDPLVQIHEIMDGMGVDELKKLVLLSANRIGILTKGQPYESNEDALMHFLVGVTTILQIYNESNLAVLEPLTPTTS